MTRPAGATNSCLVCGADVRLSLPDRATCKPCRAMAWTWFRANHGLTDPNEYQRAYNAAFGTIDGLVATIRSARAAQVAG